MSGFVHRRRDMVAIAARDRGAREITGSDQVNLMSSHCARGHRCIAVQVLRRSGVRAAMAGCAVLRPCGFAVAGKTGNVHRTAGICLPMAGTAFPHIPAVGCDCFSVEARGGLVRPPGRMNRDAGGDSLGSRITELCAPVQHQISNSTDAEGQKGLGSHGSSLRFT